MYYHRCNLLLPGCMTGTEILFIIKACPVKTGSYYAKRKRLLNDQFVLYTAAILHDQLHQVGSAGI